MFAFARRRAREDLLHRRSAQRAYSALGPLVRRAPRRSASISTASDPALADLEIGMLPAAGPPGTRLLRAVGQVRSLAPARAPHLVHAHYINEPGWLAAAARRRPVVSPPGDPTSTALRSSRSLARRLNPWAVRAADWVTCDSEDQARTLRAWSGNADRVSVIGWGVDRAEFNPAVNGLDMRRRLGLPDEARVILSPRQWLANSNIEQRRRGPCAPAGGCLAHPQAVPALR